MVPRKTGKLLLFDFDGVLADSLEIYAEAVARCLRRIGTPIVNSREDYLALFDGNFYDSMAGKGVDLVAFSEAGKEIFSGIDRSAMKPFAGLLPVLDALGKKHPLVVVSSNGLRMIEGMLERFGFDRHFEEILGSDFLISKKGKIEHAVGKYRVDPACTYYIGDTAGDVLEARAAGVRSVAVTWGWHSRERLQAVGPDIVVDRPEELLLLGGEAEQRDGR